MISLYISHSAAKKFALPSAHAFVKKMDEQYGAVVVLYMVHQNGPNGLFHTA
jgi:hypothetical protein